jgi:hypothetical protein
MVAGSHGNAANVRPAAQPAILSGFADRLVLVLRVANLAERGAASAEQASHFAARETNRNVVTFLRHQLCEHSSATNHLAALAWLHFQIVDT